MNSACKVGVVVPNGTTITSASSSKKVAESGIIQHHSSQWIHPSAFLKPKDHVVAQQVKSEEPCKKKRNYITAIEVKKDDNFVVPFQVAPVKSEKLSATCISYQGSCNDNGQCHGKGIKRYGNGDVYNGYFVNGKRHGSGTLTYADATEYVGDWENNIQHGNGTRRWKNGEIYTGQYVHGQRSGEGSFYFQNGDVFKGQFEKGVMHGFGRYYYASGQRFEGCFWNGKRHGKGKLQRVDGSLDICVYKEDARVGVGVRWSADRENAWELYNGKTKRKITLPEAIALDYEIDAAARALAATS
jgi:hypothetical protein